jgi:predicted ATP-grasp superfamily ATP-dependent carboligase
VVTPDGDRRILWPDTELWAATTDGARDLVVVIGHEPHLRWRTFCREVTIAAAEVGGSLVLTLGALLSDIPHTRPTSVTGTADDPRLGAQLDLVRSTYEGPTGIVGVLHAACRDAGLPSASLWAAVPTYVSGAPSPKATLALVERSLRVLGLNLPTVDLQIASAAYERQIDQLVAADDDTAAYVAGLEEAADDEAGRDDEDDFDHPLDAADPAELVEEVERFLRGD